MTHNTLPYHYVVVPTVILRLKSASGRISIELESFQIRPETRDVYNVVIGEYREWAECTAEVCA